MDPFETLLDIERNCKTSMAIIPRQIIAERDWFGIGFRSSGAHFVCPIHEVSEILTWPTVTEVPNAHQWFRGIANLRGRILPVTDLQGFITNKNHSEGTTSRVLVIKCEESIFGFAVENISGVERFFGNELKPATELNKIKEYLTFVKGIFEREHKPWPVLSFRAIIKMAQFYHVISNK